MGDRRGIEPVRYSTSGIAPAERHEAWSDRGWPSVAALFESTPIGPFSTSAQNVQLDGIAVSYSTGTARLLERAPERIAADRIDILGVGLLLEGEMHGVAGKKGVEGLRLHVRSQGQGQHQPLLGAQLILAHQRSVRRVGQGGHGHGRHRRIRAV